MKVRRRISSDRDMVDVGNIESRVLQAETNRFHWESCPVLDSKYPLFLDRRDEFSIDDDTGGRIAVIGVDS